MKLSEVLTNAVSGLTANGNTEAQIEAEVLLRHTLDIDRARFYASLAEPISDEQYRDFQTLIERRLNREPLAYITGHREFFGLDFIVNPHVLIPRQETELLVESALDFITKRTSSEPLKIVDACTGSGAIAVALAHHLPDVKIYASDISSEALEVAKANIRKHHVEDRVQLLEGDLLAPLSEAVHLIVSNPPYIDTETLAMLAPEVRSEPRIALDGGADGLDVVRRLLSQAPDYLLPQGLLLFEITPSQSRTTLELAKQAFPDASVAVNTDLLGLPRVVSVHRR